MFIVWPRLALIAVFGYCRSRRVPLLESKLDHWIDQSINQSNNCCQIRLSKGDVWGTKTIHKGLVSQRSAHWFPPEQWRNGRTLNNWTDRWCYATGLTSGLPEGRAAKRKRGWSRGRVPGSVWEEGLWKDFKYKCKLLLYGRILSPRSLRCFL